MICTGEQIGLCRMMGLFAHVAETRKYNEMNFYGATISWLNAMSLCVSNCPPLLLQNSIYTTYDLVNSWFRC